MTVPRLLALLKYWEHAPPLHETFARFVGIDPPRRPAPDAAADDGKKLVGELLGAGVQMYDGPSWAEQDAAFRATTDVEAEITPPESP